MTDKTEGTGGPPPQDTPPPPPPREESPKAEQLSPQEQKERAERALDLLAEELLIESRKVNEGMNGVILHFDAVAADPKLRELMEETGIDFGTEHAVKVLKVYRAEAIKHEFEMQQAAFDAVPDDARQYAIIPRPQFYREIEVSPKVREQLGSMGVHESDKIELFMMDYVDGKDLMTLMAGEMLAVIRPDIPREEIDKMSYERIEAELVTSNKKRGRRTYDFFQPGGKGATEGEREHERIKVNNDNSDVVYRFLADEGYQMDPTIQERLRRTVGKIHSNGLVHGDIHERNVMLVGDPWIVKAGKRVEEADRQSATVALIDFGTARQFEGSYDSQNEELYIDRQGFKRPNDEVVVNRMDKVVSEYVEGLSTEQRTEAERILKSNSFRLLRRNEGWVERRNSWIERRFSPENMDSELTKLFVHYVVGSAGSNPVVWSTESRWKQMTDMAVAAVEKGIVTAEDVVNGIKAVRNFAREKGAQIPVMKRLEYLEYAVRYVEEQK